MGSRNLRGTSQRGVRGAGVGTEAGGMQLAQQHHHHPPTGGDPRAQIRR